MQPEPLYHSAGVRAAFELRYSWTAWPSCPTLAEERGVLDELRPLWEADGLRMLEHSWTNESVQAVFSTTPAVSPVFLAARAKGRLQHALKAVPTFPGFSRKVSVRSLGHNVRQDVERYIASQVDAARFADPATAALVKEFTVVCGDVDLSAPTESAHGRYWHNLHLVLVTAERHRSVDRARLATLRDWSFRIAEKKGYRISRLAVMPDHLHAALRGNIQQSPQEIALAFQNNLAYALGQVRIWTDSFYVGTFGEYHMGGVRRPRSL